MTLDQAIAAYLEANGKLGWGRGLSSINFRPYVDGMEKALKAMHEHGQVYKGPSSVKHSNFSQKGYAHAYYPKTAEVQASMRAHTYSVMRQASKARVVVDEASRRKFLRQPDTLVIHLDDRSTDFLRPIYEGHGYPVISGRIGEDELLATIKQFPRVYMLGHGCPTGLFGAGFLIGDKFGPALSQKEGLFIWCNADAYAKRHKLTGLVSGMFISEVGEAAMFGIRATQEEVDASNNSFSKVVRSCLDAGSHLSQVRQCYTSAECKITKFNQERLYVFEHGVPTPALHHSSASHAIERPRHSIKWMMDLHHDLQPGEGEHEVHELPWDFDTSGEDEQLPESRAVIDSLTR